MSSIAAKSGILALCLWIWFGCAAAADRETAVVGKLYRDFAWQAFANQPELFGADIAHQGRARLLAYFTPELAGLLLRDAACQDEEGGICKLDFDLLFASQDPRVSDLEIESTGPGRATARFKDPVSGVVTRIAFEVVRINGAWKIADVIYDGPPAQSLRRRLQGEGQVAKCTF